MRKGHRIHKHAGLLVTAAFVLLLVRLAPAAPSLTLQAAEIAPDPTGAMMLSATRAGNRIVAVGDHGIVLLSDENGANFRQAKSVPVRSALTGVSFIDDKTGWVVGHWGVVLKTEDGGETWEVQRSDTSVDKPLFSVYFKDKDHGLAVGLWSLMITTSDGGRTWSTVGVPVPPGGNKADLNLFKVFADGHGTLFVAAEQGMILRSDDGGSGWTYLPTGYNGSFWTGIGLQDGALLVGGLRGTIFRSTDGGVSWKESESGVKSSITDFCEIGWKVVAVGLDGIFLESDDGGLSFKATQRDDRLPLTTLARAGSNGLLVVFSKRGIVKDPPVVSSK